jgi:hypothetical protein
MSRALQRRIVLYACLALTASTALAQHAPGGGGHGGPPMGGGFPPGGMGMAPNDRSGAMSPRAGGPSGYNTVRSGLQLGPPGRWWDDRNIAMSLGLRKEQLRKMDSAFDANKGAILENYKALQKQESNLESVTREAKLDEGKIFAAIDAVNQARSALEKANAHMLLLIRQEMDADQVARMEKLRDKPPGDE